MPRVAVSDRVPVSGRVDGSGRTAFQASQNLLVQSNGLAGGSWAGINTTAIAGTGPGPFGAADAVSIFDDAVNATHERYALGSLQPNNIGWNCVSIFLSPDTLNFGGLFVDLGTSTLISCWNLTTGASTQYAIGGSSTRIDPVLNYQLSYRQDTWEPGWRQYIVAWYTPQSRASGFFPCRIFLSQAGVYGAYIGGAGQISAAHAGYCFANWEGVYVETAGAAFNAGPLRNRNDRI